MIIIKKWIKQQLTILTNQLYLKINKRLITSALSRVNSQTKKEKYKRKKFIWP